MLMNDLFHVHHLETLYLTTSDISNEYILTNVFNNNPKKKNVQLSCTNCRNFNFCIKLINLQAWGFFFIPCQMLQVKCKAVLFIF